MSVDIKKIIISVIFSLIVCSIVFISLLKNRENGIFEGVGDQSHFYSLLVSSRYPTSTSQPSKKVLLRFQNELQFAGDENSVTISDEEYVFLLSKFGNRDTQFECFGSCRCDTGISGRRNARAFQRGMVYLISSISSLLAMNKAKSYFESECRNEIFDSECPEDLIISKVESCRPVQTEVQSNSFGGMKSEAEDGESEETKKHSVIFLCRGNMARSPTCECIFRQMKKKRDWKIDSCAAPTNIDLWKRKVKGLTPDENSMEILERHFGKEIRKKYVHNSRQITHDDFREFEYILCTDDENYENCMEVYKNVENPTAKVKKITDYHEKLEEIPDPYLKEMEVFEEVYQMCKECCTDFLNHVENYDSKT